MGKRALDFNVEDILLTPVHFYQYKTTLPQSLRGIGPYHFPILLNTGALYTWPQSPLIQFPQIWKKSYMHWKLILSIKCEKKGFWKFK